MPQQGRKRRGWASLRKMNMVFDPVIYVICCCSAGILGIHTHTHTNQTRIGSARPGTGLEVESLQQVAAVPSADACWDSCGHSSEEAGPTHATPAITVVHAGKMFGRGHGNVKSKCEFL